MDFTFQTYSSKLEVLSWRIWRNACTKCTTENKHRWRL